MTNDAASNPNTQITRHPRTTCRTSNKSLSPLQTDLSTRRRYTHRAKRRRTRTRRRKWCGKTTIIKHILGLLKAKSGTVSVFGLDSVIDPEGVLGRIGYLSADRDLPGWMRVHELIRYQQAFYPKWDPDYAEELRQLFELDPTEKLKTLSRGQLAKAGLLAPSHTAPTSYS